MLEDMLKAYVINFKSTQEKLLSLVEFAYNNSYQDTIDMAPYKALYGRKCRNPMHWEKVGEQKIVGPKLLQQT